MDRRLSLLGRPFPPGFELRVVVLAPGAERDFDEAEWHDSIVVVEHGELDLECDAGGQRSFAAGDVLWLTDLSLRLMRNPGREPVVLAAVSRRAS